MTARPRHESRPKLERDILWAAQQAFRYGRSTKILWANHADVEAIRRVCGRPGGILKGDTLETPTGRLHLRAWAFAPKGVLRIQDPAYTQLDAGAELDLRKGETHAIDCDMGVDCTCGAEPSDRMPT